jgi:Phosphodiester glycosidase
VHFYGLPARTFWLRFSKFEVSIFQIFLAAVLSFASCFGGTFLYQADFLKQDNLTAFAETARAMNLDVVVAIAEDIYYGDLTRPGSSSSIDPIAIAAAANHQVSNADRKLSNLHPVANVAAWGAAQRPSNLPSTLTSVFSQPLAQEGQWHATKITVAGAPAIYTARVRTEPSLPNTFATVAWLDTKLLSFAQYAGYALPEGNYNRGTGEVASNLKPFYVASFAGAYLLKHSQGGYIYNNQLVKKMVDGKATLLTYPDGTIAIEKWGSSKIRPGFSTARQNLDLDVADGINQVKDESQSKWGWVWEGVGSGSNLVYRTGIGIRADGTLVYVTGKALSAKSLADLLVNAGAVNAMALDMNVGFAHSFFYGPYMKQGGIPINPDRAPAKLQFWNASDRDFIAVFAKSGPK